MGGGLDSSSVVRVYGADGAVLYRRTAPSAPHTHGRMRPKHVELRIH